MHSIGRSSLGQGSYRDSEKVREAASPGLCVQQQKIRLISHCINFAPQESQTMRVWNRDRFSAAGEIKWEMAKSSLRRDCSEEMTQRMIGKLNEERQQVRFIMKNEIENLLRLGAEVCQMTFKCKNTNLQQTCVTAKNMCDSYVQDGSTFNIKCLHWIFDELPTSTHRDVLSQRKSHMDLAVERVEREMSIVWGAMKDGETKNHRNCLQKVYSKILNDKKQTIIREEGTTHKRKPLVHHPKSVAAAKNTTNYKRGKAMYFWSSEAEGEHLVRRKVSDSHVSCHSD
jgi:hypothetical protein